jgi:hypothetical protein
VIVCREIGESDVDAVVGLLTREFTPTRSFWIRAMKTLADHPTPPGFPKYGYVLVDEGRVVAVLLLISTRSGGEVRTNVSSWCAEESYRQYAPILTMRATRRLDTTYFITTPAPHTWRILETQGFRRFANGRILSILALCRTATGVRARMFSSDLRPTLSMPQSELDLLDYHTSHGCLSIICDYADHHYPFVFCRQYKFGFLPLAHLIYCRELDDFLRFAGTVGRLLLRCGFAAVIMDAEGPIPGIGKYFGNRPRFRKGGDEVRIGNVAYSEQVLWGY